MTNIRIQAATPNSDFAAIKQIYYTTWQVAYWDLIPASFLKQLSPASWHPERRWQNTFLAIDDIAGIVGVCSYGPARMAERAGWGELYSIYVLPAFQRQHVGERLLNAALKELDGAYLTTITRRKHFTAALASLKLRRSLKMRRNLERFGNLLWCGSRHSNRRKTPASADKLPIFLHTPIPKTEVGIFLPTTQGT